MFQIFRKSPTLEVSLSVLNAFNLQSFDDDRIFTRKDIMTFNTVEKMTALISILSEYYIPCKARAYLSKLDEKNVVTILRHVAKAHGYKVASKEKYRDGDKFINYQVISKTATIKKPLNGYITESSEVIVSFD